MDPIAPAVVDLADALSRVVRLGGLPRFADHVAGRAGIHLDRSAYVLLATLVAQPRRIGELAELLSLDVSTVSRQVHSLEGAGLARREPLPDDRRGSLLVATEAGEVAVEAQRRARRELFAELLADTPRDELATVARLLHRLADRLEVMAGA
jgi:DNA-binding MarR family transcriptional regulator